MLLVWEDKQLKFYLDMESFKYMWHISNASDLENLRVAFQFLSKEDIVPNGYKETTCRASFHVKMDLTRKPR